MSALQTSSLQVQTDLRAITQILAWLETLDHRHIPTLIWFQCQLAIAEGFTNAVRHAHKHQPPETPIRIEIDVSETALEVRIWDQGPPFDLMDQLQHLPPNNADAEGGRGLILLKKIADELSYGPKPEGYNCLTLRKQYRADSSTSA